MRTRTGMALLLGAWIAAAGSLAAQTATAARPQAESRLDAAFTWNSMRGPIAGGGSFWMQGAGFQLHEQFWRGLGVVADIAGTHTANIGSTDVGLDLLTVTFGPRCTWSRHRFSIYGQGLVGQAFGFHSLFPAPNGATTSDNSLAALAGGGMNIRVTPRIAVRLLEAGWLHTQLPNTASNVQNNFTLATGIVLRLR